MVCAFPRLYHTVMAQKRKRIALELSPRHVAELEAIMANYGLDATNAAIRVIISRIFREDGLEYPADYKNQKQK